MLTKHSNCCRLDGPTTTIVFAWSDNVPRVVWHGARLTDDLDLASFIDSQQRALSQATLDVTEPLSMHPENSRGWLGYPAMSGQSPQSTGSAGRWAGQFKFQSAEESHALDDQQSVLFRLHDEPRGLQLEIDCRIDSVSDVASFASRLRNTGDDPFQLDWLSAATVTPEQRFNHLKTFHGRWCAEFDVLSRPVPMGLTMLENRRGRTSHESFPGVILCQETTHENQGECIGVHLGWSGNHRVLIERMSSGDVQVQMGVLFAGGEALLNAGESIDSPPMYVAHSSHGFNSMSQKLHAYARRRLISFPESSGKPAPRPVTVNTWEAVYFDHDQLRLRALVDAAADIGAERFVLDDGWFKGRNDDTSSLGDWYPDPSKYPQGLKPLADYVRSRGLQFGLWVEPEMVNPRSELLREHPDWALGLESYAVVTGRNQLVLDLNNADVEAYLFQRLEELVEENEVAYLKWDMNREYVTPADKHGHASAWRQTEALYRLYDRMLSRFPGLEIESCASGGGRIDFGILSRCHRFWTSDSNDPVERMQIQTGFSYFFPPEVMGAHVGPRWSHTSGRGLHTGLRTLVASWGHFGIEADLNTLEDDEREVIRKAVVTYKQDRDIWHTGRISRVRTVDPALLGSLAVSTAADRARLVLVQMQRPRSTLSPHILVPGLDSERFYQVSLSVESEMVKKANRDFEHPLWREGYRASGAVLGQAGIAIPALYAQTAIAIAIDAVLT